MASEINTIPQIICTFNQQYLIYNFKYTFTPQEGIRIRIYFVSPTGTYIAPKLTTKTKTSISILGSSFNLSVNPVKFGFEFKSGRRILWVDFVDDTFQLDNYYVAITGTACGFHVYQLGTPVDSRTASQQIGQAIDPVAQQIRNFTEFPDYEYGFQDFLNILRPVFPLGTIPAFDSTLKRAFVGTFKEVLKQWCKFYNFAWFFENGLLKIVNPATVILPFTSFTTSTNFIPQDIIEYEYTESLEDTYGKTVWQWYQQQGNEMGINSAGNNVIVNSTLFPLGQNLNGTEQISSEIQDSLQGTLGDISNIVNPSTPNLASAQIIPDPNQVAAALYGKRFWFLYNYFNGTASSECGWTAVNQNTLSQSNAVIAQTVIAARKQLAVLDEDYFDQKYESYVKFAQSIAGRYYISNEVSNIDDMRTYQWYNVTNGQIFDFTSTFADSLKIDMQYALSQDGSVQAIDGTNVNQFYDGIKYVGNVMWYKDSTFPGTTQFVLDGTTSSVVNNAFENIMKGDDATKSWDYSEFTQSINGTSSQGLLKYISYTDIVGYPNPPTAIQGYINNLAAVATALQPQFSTFNVVGTKKADVNNLKVINQLPSSIAIIDSNLLNAPNSALPTLFSNNSLLRVPKDGGYVIYYDKISNCISAYTDGDYYQHVFIPRNISQDIPTPQTLQINSQGNYYLLNRDMTYVNNTLNQQLLNTLAAARTFNTIELSFSLNYINIAQLPLAFLSAGLVGLDIEVGDDGIKVNYKYSNKILEVEKSEAFIEQLELQIKNSWIRNYYPKNVSST